MSDAAFLEQSGPATAKGVAGGHPKDERNHRAVEQNRHFNEEIVKDPRKSSWQHGNSGAAAAAAAAAGGNTGTGLGNNQNYNNTTAGPHSSNLANKADPRVDSDMDGRNRHTTTGGGLTGTGATGTGLGNNNTGLNNDNTGLGNNSNYNSTNAGPHSSNLANKADPRVDSDMDGRNRHANTHTTTGTSGLTGSSTSNTYGNTSTNAGPHSSNLANKADPRVDSDMDGRNRHAGTTGGLTGSGGGLTGNGGGLTGGSTNAGPHNSNIANKADPRVDSDRDGSGLGGGYQGQGALR